MKRLFEPTQKAAASIYVVIFTSTLLGVITLGFVRLMLAESTRMNKYSLSQSALHSALDGVEDAKIVLLRYQNCLSTGSYSKAGTKTANCKNYLEKWLGQSSNPEQSAASCNVVGALLHGVSEDAQETMIRTQTKSTSHSKADVTDQAYTCVKMSALTEDFLATLADRTTKKLIPLRPIDASTVDTVDRISVQWFTDVNLKGDNNRSGVARMRSGKLTLDSGYYGFASASDTNSALKGTLATNKNAFTQGNDTYTNAFQSNKTGTVPPLLQVSLIQSDQNFSINDFYSSNGANTDRGMLLFRPTSNASTDLLDAHNMTTSSGNHSNSIDYKNNTVSAMAYSANKSFNTPIDVYCQPASSNWGDYACSVDFVVPRPRNGGARNLATFYLMLNLPYGLPETDVSVKMYHCGDNQKTVSQCQNVKFAYVQPKIDSTGRANDLFRRVEARVELADVNYPIAEFALASTGDTDADVVKKDFYVTKNCKWTTSSANSYGKITGTVAPKKSGGTELEGYYYSNTDNGNMVAGQDNVLRMSEDRSCYNSTEL